MIKIILLQYTFSYQRTSNVLSPDFILCDLRLSIVGNASNFRGLRDKSGDPVKQFPETKIVLVRNNHFCE